MHKSGSSKHMKRVAVDMDEVLADTVAEHLSRYNRDHGEAITKADLKGKWLWEIVSIDRHERLEGYLRSEDFFEDLPVVADSQRVLELMAGRYEIFIASSAMEFPNSFGPKYRWLRRHFPFLDPRHFVFCGDKSILRADVLIDDQPRNLQVFAGRGVLFSAPHNLNVSGFTRVDDWAQVERLFLMEGGVE